MSVEFVIKRNNERQAFNFEKINERIDLLNRVPYPLSCNPAFVTSRLRDEGIENGITTTELDNRMSKFASELYEIDTDYLVLASRIAISNHQKNTTDCFSDCIRICYLNKKKNGKNAPRINKILYKFVQLHKNAINHMVDYTRDFTLSYSAFTTLMKNYLIKRSTDEVITRPQDFVIERPQDMWMRVACAIHMNRDNIADTSVLEQIKETYDALSLGYIMHASPTLFNAGTWCEQYLSCFLLYAGDSMEDIAKVKGDMMKISKYAGGVGFTWDLRSSGSEVATTNGRSDGPIPFLRSVEADMKATNQGGKRKGSAANYMEITHPDFIDWVRLRLPDNKNGIHDLFYGVCVSDVFMKHVKDDQLWYFIDPSDHPHLANLYGEAYTNEYLRIVSSGATRGEPIMARKLWLEILRMQCESGAPYILFRDAANKKSNQKNIGTIRTSNLCIEILEYSSKDEYACCALGTVCLPKFVRKCQDNADLARIGSNGKHYIDYEAIAKYAGVLTRNLTKINKINFYPLPETERSQRRHMPLGIGAQGLADMFQIMDYPFTSNEARLENRRVYESIYYGCLRASCDIAQLEGAYETFLGDPLNNPENPNVPSPFSQGILQYDMWGLNENDLKKNWNDTVYWPWSELKQDIVKYGVKNSLLTAQPPTATTSLIQGNNEAHEPYTSNMYVRTTLTGQNAIINNNLVQKLKSLGLWNRNIREQIIINRGSVQNIAEIPEDVKNVYKTAFELDPVHLIEMDAERGVFIDQTQSSNRFVLKPDASLLFRMYYKAWRLGLKTCCYYLRTQSRSQAAQFTYGKKNTEDQSSQSSQVDQAIEEMTCEMKRVNGVMCYSCQ